MVKKVVKTTITEVKEDKPKKKKGTQKKSSTKKKSTRKKSSTKKKATTRKKSTKTTTTVVKPSFELLALTKRSFENLEKRDSLLIENFVGLQEAMTNLSTKFSELSQNLNNLLGVFELAAKTLAESEKQVDNTLSSKLDTLIEQNKAIARDINTVEAQKMQPRKTMMPARGPAPQPMYAPSPAPKPITRPAQPVAQQGIPPKELPKI